MAGFIPAPAKPSVTADPPLAIVGNPDRTMLLAGTGGGASFQRIGTNIPILIPTGPVLPLPQARPVGSPFHVVGTPGVKVVVGLDGSGYVHDGFTGPAGEKLAGRSFDDGSGIVWKVPSSAPHGGLIELDGFGRINNHTPGQTHSQYCEALLAYPNAYWVSLTVHLPAGIPTSEVQSAFGMGITFTDGNCVNNVVGAYISPGLGGAGPTCYGRSHFGHPINGSNDYFDGEPLIDDVEVTVAMYQNGNTTTISVTGFQDSANVTGQFTNNTPDGYVGLFTTATVPSIIPEDILSQVYAYNFQAGNIGTKAWE